LKKLFCKCFRILTVKNYCYKTTKLQTLPSGDTDEKAKATLKDAKLLQQFKDVEQMDDDDKNMITKLIDAFVTKRKIQQVIL